MAFSARSAKYKDGALNRFVKTNLFFETNPYILFQDPTYLGFKLFFLVNQPDSKLLSDEPLPNTAMSYLYNIGDTARMHYLQKFVQHLVAINQQTPWFFQSIEGLAEAWKHGFQEADFKPKLGDDRKISIKCLESIDLRMTALIDLYRKACFDWPNRREVVPKNLRQFTMYIYCYENRTINVKGQPGSNSLSSLKEYAALPEVNQRQIDQNKILLGLPLSKGGGAKPIPSATEITAGVQSIIGIGGGEEDDGFDNDSQFANTINDNINRVMFKFDLCEWLPDESGVIGAKINNITGEAADQTLAFSYKTVYEENVYNMFSGISVTDLNYILDQSSLDNADKTLTGLRSKFTEGGGFGLQSITNGNFNALTPFASMAADRLTEAISSKAKGLLLGNIFGFSPANVAGAAQSILTGDPSAMVQGVTQLANAGGGASIKNATNKIQGAPNVFDSITGALGGIVDNGDLGNIFNDRSASLANDNGPDAKSQGTGNPTASLANDNGPDAKSQGTGNSTASLTNNNSSGAKSQGKGNDQSSLSNDNGSDAKSQGTGNSTASLSNNPSSGAKTQGSGNPTASLANDNGPDAKSQGTGNDRASLSNG